MERLDRLSKRAGPFGGSLSITLIFSVIGLIFILIYAEGLWSTRIRLEERLHGRAVETADNIADGIARELEQRFLDLTFLRNTFFTELSRGVAPDARAQAALQHFQHDHPSVFAIALLDPSGERILWSSRKGHRRPITDAASFQPLPGHPDQLLGQAVHDGLGGGWVVTMRQRITDPEGRVIGFIGSPYRLSALASMHTSPLVQVVVRTDRDGQVSSAWRKGRWAAPDTLLPQPAGSVSRPVPGFPWTVRAQWTDATLRKALWAEERLRLLVLGLILLFVLANERAVQWVYGRMTRLRRYQDAALRIQQDLLGLGEEEAIYARMTELVVVETGALGAFVVVPGRDDSRLVPVAAAADCEDLRAAMMALTPSRDAADRPHGMMAPSRAFREGVPIGPLDPHKVGPMREVQEADPALARIGAIMAYPIQPPEATEPAAVLVIEETAPGHFTAAVRRLLEQLALSVGVALSRLRHHQEIAEASNFNASLFNTVGAVALVINIDGVIERMNQVAEDFMGCRLDDVRGQPFCWLRFIPEDERERVLEMFRTIPDHGLPREAENHWLTGSGEKRLLHWVNSILDDGEGRASHVIALGVDVTEQRAMQKALHTESAKNRALLKFAADGIHVLDETGHLIDANDSFCAMLGYTLDEVRGMRPSQWDTAFTQEELAALIDRQLNAPAPLFFETRHRRKDGSVFDVEVSGVPIEIDGHKVLFNASRDISERKAMEAKLHDNGLRLRRLSDFNTLMAQVNQAIAAATDEQALLREICDLAVRYAHLELAVIARPDPEGRFVFPAAAGRIAYLDGLAVSTDPSRPEGQGGMGTTWREQRALFNEFASSSPHMAPWRERLIEHGLKSTATLPIIRRAEMWGVLVLYHSEQNIFDKDLRAVLEELCFDISRGLDLLATRNLQRALLNSSVVGILLVKDHIIRQINPYGAQMLGFDPEEMEGRSTRILFADDADWTRIGEAYGPMAEGAEARVAAVRMRHRDGRIRFGEFSGVDLEGQRGLYVWTVEDVTERELQTRRLRRLADFNALLSEANEAIGRAGDEAELLQSLCELAVEHAHLTQAWIGRPDEEGWLRFLASAGDMSRLDAIRLSVLADGPGGQEPAGQAWRERRPAFNWPTDDSSPPRPWAAPGEAQGFRIAGVRALASTPIFRGGAIWGVMTISHGEEDVFDTEAQAILTDLAQDIGYGLDRLDSARRERESNALNTALLGYTRAAIALVRYPERRFVRVNRGFLDLLGYRDFDQVVGRHAQEIYPKGTEFERLGAAADQILAHGSQNLENLQLRRTDGRTIFVDAFGQLMEGNDPENPVIVWTALDVTERHQLTSELARQALFDKLTGLPNRRALDQEFEKAMARVRRSGRVLAVVMLDLDGFKPINDTYGHDVGDRVLRVIGQRLRDTLRQTDFVARLGGDEFVLLIEDCGTVDEISVALAKVEAAIGQPIPMTREPGAVPRPAVQVGASAGICLYPVTQTDNPESLLRYADHALYENKASKSDRLRFWTIYGEGTPKRQNRMQSLLRDGALTVFYQPVLDNSRGEIVGIEALARLQDGPGRVLSPAEFLPHLQPDDLFVLSRGVFAQALRDLEILDRDNKPLWVSVNIDPRNITDRCVSALAEQMAGATVDPSRIYLEILEGSNFQEQNLALEHLHALKGLGVRLALDDVGSAYSSLLRLKDLPIDKVKLDQGFVRTLEQRPEDLQFVESVYDLATGLGLRLVVEGVETADILDAMCMLQVPVLQGYGIARPMPLEDLRVFLRRPVAPRHDHPTSVLGLYAKQFAGHGTLKRAILRNSHMLVQSEVGEAALCPIHGDLGRLGIGASHPIARLHHEYHRAIARLGERVAGAPGAIDLGELETVERRMLDAMVAEYRRRKAAAAERRDLTAVTG